jgi:hypothetical protein
MSNKRQLIPIENMIRLWHARVEALEQCAAVVVNNKPLKDQLSAMASAYLQCAAELRNPPMELFKDLGYDVNLR